MPIVIQCPNATCGGTSTIADTFSGRRVICNKCGQPFVANPTRVGERSDTKNSQPASTSNPFPRLPAEFGRYRILRLLGQGGMGAVYLAEDSQLGRQAALKIPFFNASEFPELIERFIREARSAASLQHPNICTVFDAGQIEGKPFITMAFIAGIPLDHQIDPDAPMPQRRAAEIARKIAIALQHAHDNGTVHRDLKPANVMIATSGEPVVMDFGLAKQTAEVSPNEAKLTRYGGILGTPSYMSPEQVRGDTQAIGPATDIYSLGVMLFEMLTGQTPYSGALGRVMGQILAAPVPPVQEFRQDVGLLLDAICQKAMAKDPKARFGSMAEFAQALEDYLTNPASVVGVELVEPPRPVPTPVSIVQPVQPRRPIPAPVAVAEPVAPPLPVVDHSSSFEWDEPKAPAQVRQKPQRRAEPRRTRLWIYPAALTGAVVLVILAATVIGKKTKKNAPQIEVAATNDPKVDVSGIGKTVTDVADKTELATKVDPVHSGRPRREVGRGTDPSLNVAPSDPKVPTAPDAKKPDPVPSGNGVMPKEPVERTEEFVYMIEGVKKTGTRRVLVLDIGGGEMMEFVRIPRGTFLMGAPVGELLAAGEEKPQHQVELSRDFYLGKFEVTQAQYKAVTGGSPSFFKGDRLPVEQVSWVEAVNFCEKVSVWTRRKVELPSEAEWEYACRAGTTTPFHFGTRLIGDLANCRGDSIYGTEVKEASNGTTVNVGLYPANPWGLYDMHGNVSEWCRDYYGPYEAINQRSNPIQLIRQAKDCRIIRGGSWSHIARYCRAAMRFYVPPVGRGYCDGFRVCLRLVPGEADPAPKVAQVDPKVPTAPDAKKPDPFPSGNGVMPKEPVERTEGFEYEIEGLKKKGVRRILELDIGGGEKMEFVLIRKGTFQMGAPIGEFDELGSVDYKPQRRVTISRDFYIGKFEVTQAQYKAVTGAEPSFYKGSGRLPVERVSWAGAEAFCSKLSKQVKRTVDLPTEAVWEYACRAGTTTPFHFGSNLNGDRANCNGNQPYGTTNKGKYVEKTMEVGQYFPNQWGLYDMHGNVLEWCKDYYGPYGAIGTIKDPFQSIMQAKEYRVFRGGACHHSAGGCRAASRGRNMPDSVIPNVGFRVYLPLE